jgi:predicted O-methyltransferase YrrM
MKIRTDLLQHIVETKKPKKYLEIGIQRGVNFDAIDVPYKIGVEPFPRQNQKNVLTMLSDDFFKEDNKEYDGFDLVFIDGLHTYAQTRTDLYNALERLNDNGIIVMHDALPHNLEYTSMDWCGTSYQAVMEAAQDTSLIVKTWDQDHGCAVIIKNPKAVSTDDVKIPDTSFETLWKDNGTIVGKMTTDEIVSYIKTLP